MGNKQKYFNQNSIQYSSINQNGDFQDEVVPNDSFPFGILNLFRHIQRNKCKDDESDLTKGFEDDFEVNTDMIDK